MSDTELLDTDMNHYVEKASHVMETVPDSAKLVVAASSPMASLFGMTVEEWSFALSGIVALLFIIEKMYRFYKWIRDEKSKSCSSE